ncbi:MAG TPA: hypothetical protein VEW66_07755 [Thermomicrobiales bacterium]|nr:hypothetical protein [Thermomicrobiales bacterium]
MRRSPPALELRSLTAGERFAYAGVVFTDTLNGMEPVEDTIRCPEPEEALQAYRQKLSG